MLRRMLHLVFCLTFVALLGACTDPPVERTISRFETLSLLLDSNKEDPDKLLSALEGFVNENKAAFKADREEVEAIDYDQQRELEARYERALRRQLDELLNAILEAQDRLSDHPDKLLRFQKLIGQLR